MGHINFGLEGFLARYNNPVWTDFITRILAMLPLPASDPRGASASDLNTQDQREYRQSTVGNGEELAGAEIRESLDNLRW
jgi:hypothetical protein